MTIDCYYLTNQPKHTREKYKPTFQHRKTDTDIIRSFNDRWNVSKGFFATVFSAKSELQHRRYPQ